MSFFTLILDSSIIYYKHDFYWNFKLSLRYHFLIYIWNGFIRSLSWITIQIGWRVGDGKKLRLGVDHVAGLNTSFVLSEDLRMYLTDFGIIMLNHACNL